MSPLIFFLLACFASLGIIIIRKYFYGKLSKSKKFYPLVLFLYLFLLVLFIYFFIPLSSPSLEILNNPILMILGLISIYVGVGFFSWAYLYLGLIGTIGGLSLGVKEDLVTSGPYKYTRNPQYFGILLFLFGFSFLTKSIYLIIFSTLWSVLFYVIALSEEKELEESFGQEYIEYRKKVPRFIFKWIG